MTTRITFLAVVASFLLSGTLTAQSGEWNISRVDLTRADLEALLARYEAVVESRAYSEELRAESRVELEAVRTRLREGDFRVGDRILLRVRGEPELSDTLVVNSQRVLEVPLIGPLNLRGVLLSELESRLTRHISQLINDPVVDARPMIRLTMLGQVGQPGFYTFPVEMPLADALMTLGGPSQNVDFERSKIERGTSQSLWTGDQLKMALSDGKTLQELQLRSGDRVFLAAERDAGRTGVGGGFGRGGGAGGFGRVSNFIAPVLSSLVVTALIGIL